MIFTILKECYVDRATIIYCGDGCCSELIWESEKMMPGETLDDGYEDFSVETLIEGEDYKTE